MRSRRASMRRASASLRNSRSRCSAASRTSCSRRSAARRASRSSSSCTASTPADVVGAVNGAPVGLGTALLPKAVPPQLSNPASVAAAASLATPPPPCNRCRSIWAFSRANRVSCSRSSSALRSASCLATLAASISRDCVIICSRAMALMLAMDWLCKSSSTTHRCCRMSKASVPNEILSKTCATALSPGKTSSINCWNTLRSSFAASNALRHAVSRRRRESTLTGLSCAAASSNIPSLSGRSSLQKR
mmetsp:Transcript_144270/g.402093  ORF Transcript_144270/g.402093 Transcript_144270/m.402093 type:complete len:248 (+) Transcript_144270:629-1372(+)